MDKLQIMARMASALVSVIITAATGVLFEFGHLAQFGHLA